MLGDLSDKLPLLIVKKNKWVHLFHNETWYMLLPLSTKPEEAFKWLDARKDHVIIYENIGKEFDLSQENIKE
jgi:hypothetical protein